MRRTERRSHTALYGVGEQRRHIAGLRVKNLDRGTGGHRLGCYDIGDAHPFPLEANVALLNAKGLRDDIRSRLPEDLAADRRQSVDGRLNVRKIRVATVRRT